MARLEDLDLVVRDGTTGGVRCAYPFSATASPHVVTLAGRDRPVCAMCAVDALGMPFMLRTGATITSPDPRTGGPVQVEVEQEGEVRWQPASAVVVLGGLASAGSASALCCPVMNFFETSESAAAYLAQRPDFDGYWGAMIDPSTNPIAAALNSRPKFVVSTSLTDPQWAGTSVLTGDVAAAVGDLKAQQGRHHDPGLEPEPLDQDRR